MEKEQVDRETSWLETAYRQPENGLDSENIRQNVEKMEFLLEIPFFLFKFAG